MVSEAWESEKSIKGMENALKNAGVSVDTYSGKMQKLAGVLQNTTAFTDEELMTSMTNLLYVTQDVGAAMQGAGVAADMARALNMDLNTATMLLGKAFEGNVTALNRYGIKLKDGVTGMEALEAVQKRFTGAAKEFTATGAGEWETFLNNLGDKAEEAGKKFSTWLTPALHEINEAMNPSLKGLEDKFKIQSAVIEKYRKELETTEGQYSRTLLGNRIKQEEAILGIIKSKIDVIKQSEKDTQDALNKTNNTLQETQTEQEKVITLFDLIRMSATRAGEANEQAMTNASNAVNTALPYFQMLGTAIGETAAGATDAWRNFAVSALTAVLDMVEKSIVAFGIKAMAEQNWGGVALAAGGVVAVESLKAGANYTATSGETTSTTSTGSTSYSGASTAGATTQAVSGAATATNLSINLYNPVFMSRESQLATINDMLTLAANNGWNITKTATVQMA
jgi:hypothetical protein